MKFYKDEQEVRDEIEKLNKTIALHKEHLKVWEAMVGSGEDDEVEKMVKFFTVRLRCCDRKMHVLNIRLQNKIKIAPLEKTLEDINAANKPKKSK